MEVKIALAGNPNSGKTTMLTVISSLAGNLILQVKDSRIALDRELANRIMVRG